jgi:hypothetical protein
MTSGWAQVINHNQVWTDVSASFKATERLIITPETGYRIEPSIQMNQVYFRTYFSYRATDKIKLSVWAAHFNTWRANGQRAMEVRTSQYVYLFWPRIKGFKFEHRFGLDQRMFYHPGYELRKYVHRSRFRLGLHTPRFSMLGSERRFYANGSFEILRNMNQTEVAQWIDHDWITVVFGVELNQRMKLETNVLLINCLDPLTSDFEREITVFRLRLKCKL